MLPALAGGHRQGAGAATAASGGGQGAGATHRGLRFARAKAIEVPAIRVQAIDFVHAGANSGSQRLAPHDARKGFVVACHLHRTAIGSAGVLRPEQAVCINRVHSTTPWRGEPLVTPSAKRTAVEAGLAPGAFGASFQRLHWRTTEVGRGGGVRNQAWVRNSRLWSWDVGAHARGGFPWAKRWKRAGMFVLTHRHDRWPASDLKSRFTMFNSLTLKQRVIIQLVLNIGLRVVIVTGCPWAGTA